MTPERIVRRAVVALPSHLNAAFASDEAPLTLPAWNRTDTAVPLGAGPDASALSRYDQLRLVGYVYGFVAGLCEGCAEAEAIYCVFDTLEQLYPSGEAKRLTLRLADGFDSFGTERQGFEEAQAQGRRHAARYVQPGGSVLGRTRRSQPSPSPGANRSMA